MRTKYLLGLALFMTIYGILTGCSSMRKGSTIPLLGTNWTLTEVEGKSVVAIDGLQPQTLRLDPANHRAAGCSGINRYGGGFDLDGSRLEFGMFMGTRMAGPSAAMNAEELFMNLLPQTKVWQIRGSHLELSSQHQVILRFRASQKGQEN